MSSTFSLWANLGAKGSMRGCAGWVMIGRCAGPRGLRASKKKLRACMRARVRESGACMACTVSICLPDELPQVVWLQALASRVAGVDQRQAAHALALGARLRAGAWAGRCKERARSRAPAACYSGASLARTSRLQKVRPPRAPSSLRRRGCRRTAPSPLTRPGRRAPGCRLGVGVAVQGYISVQGRGAGHQGAACCRKWRVVLCAPLPHRSLLLYLGQKTPSHTHSRPHPPTQHGHGGAVQGVLGDGHQQRVVLVPQQRAQHDAHRGRGAWGGGRGREMRRASVRRGAGWWGASATLPQLPPAPSSP